MNKDVLIEVIMAKKHCLYWSQCINENENVNGAYVYRPKLPIEPFLSISKRFEQLNDYIFAQLCASYDQLSSAQDELFSLETKLNLWILEKENAENNVNTWDYNLTVFAMATPIFLISTFIEWTLSLLLSTYNCGLKTIKKSNKSKIELMLDAIITNNALNISIPDSFTSQLKKYRQLRNKFAHGDWDSMGRFDDLDVYNYMLHTTRLLECLEYSLIKEKHSFK